MKPSMLTTDRVPLDCFSMAKRRKALKTQSRECLQVDAHFLKDHTTRYKELRIDENWKVNIPDERYNHLDIISTTHQR
jgi:hypothetical protein